jgi:hypothetical protein
LSSALLVVAALGPGGALAQSAPPRTLEEVKNEVQARAERKAYPVAGRIRSSP